MVMPLLSAFYFGSVEHFRLLARYPRVLIDTGEHYVRQSHRTRTRIVGPNGPQDLSVQILHDHGSKMPMREVRLSYAETCPSSTCTPSAARMVTHRGSSITSTRSRPCCWSATIVSST